MIQRFGFLVVLVLCAIGIGLFVYPTHPFLVWGLLFLCWVCFRLSLRAQALFGKRDNSTNR